MYCTHRGAKLEVDARFCTSCGALVASAGTESVENDVKHAGKINDEAKAAEPLSSDRADAAEPVATAAAAPFGSVANETAHPASPAAGQSTIPAAGGVAAQTANQAPGQMANQVACQTAAKKSKKTFYIIIGAVAAAIVVTVVAFLALSGKLGAGTGTTGQSVKYGQKDAVFCSSVTLIKPRGKDSKPLKSYTATVVDDQGASRSIKVKGDGGFALKSFSGLKPGKYTVVIRDKASKTEWSMPVSYASKESSNTKAPSEITPEPAFGDSKRGSGAYDKSSPYRMYNQKCQEYIATYGEPSCGSVDGSYEAVFGLACARLIDFNNDGQDELYVVYCSQKQSDVSNPDTLHTAYESEVWAMSDGGIRCVFRKVLSPNDAGLVDSSIYSKDNELYLENDMKQTTEGYIGWEFDRFDGNSFVTDCTIEQNGNGNGATALVNGKQVSIEEQQKTLNEYDPSINYGLLCDEGQSDMGAGDCNSTLNVTKDTLAKLLE